LRTNSSLTLFSGWVLLLVIFLPVATSGESSPGEAATFLPERIGTFKARGAAAAPAAGFLAQLRPAEAGVTSTAARSYVGADGTIFIVDLVRTRMESAAYALLTHSTMGQDIKLAEIGTAGSTNSSRTVFFKGRDFVQISSNGTTRTSEDELIALARGVAARLEAGEKEIPVLTKHLPDWQKASQRAVYAITLQSLKETVSNQPVLDAVDFEGGTEAVVANYDRAQLVIVEFSTPQLASNNDWNMRVKIQGLRSQGQPAPTSYRRVGNYAVFVFNAANEQSADQLIDQVKYEQVVQWLGDNPNWLRDAQKRYTETMLGTFVSVVKASGLAAVLCFGVGGLFGALLFSRRRSQQAAQQAYTDAGGMMRLNIDELSAETDPHRLLGSGKR
jgi:hypothetical protein